MNLKKSYERVMQEFDKAIENFPWENKEAYALWLTQTYHFVCHSTRLLATASGRFPLSQNNLHYRFAKHISEESKHEKLAEVDLKNLGFNLNSFPELVQTSSFYQSQYYWIEHVNPIAFYGYILMLEGGAVRKGTYIFKRIEKPFGPKTGNFLKVHSDEDQDHLEDAFKHLEDLNEEQVKVIEKNMVHSCEIYCSILEKIKTQVGFKNMKSAS